MAQAGRVLCWGLGDDNERTVTCNETAAGQAHSPCPQNESLWWQVPNKPNSYGEWSELSQVSDGEMRLTKKKALYKPVSA